MKKALALIIIFVGLQFIMSAQVAYFIKPSAPLNGNETDGDSVYIDQSDIVRVDALSSGSQVTYYRNQSKKSVNVREQIGDSAWTFASFSFTLLTNDSLTSVTVAGVNISGAVPQAGSLNATASAIADSINATTSSPNYTATVSTATITIQPAADSTATPNGRAVVVTYEGSASPTNGILSGGFYRRNLSTIYGANNRLFSVSEQNNSSDLLINADRVSEMTGDNPTTIWYNGVTNQNITVTDNRLSILTTIDGL